MDVYTKCDNCACRVGGGCTKHPPQPVQWEIEHLSPTREKKVVTAWGYPPATMGCCEGLSEV